MDLKTFHHQFIERAAFFDKIITHCQQLLSSPIAELEKSYLNNRVSAFDQEKFRFAYFPPNDQLQLLTDNFNKEELLKYELIYQQPFSISSPLEHHNLIFPLTDEWGRIVSLIGRSLLSSEELEQQKFQKYKYLSGKNPLNKYKKAINLFGLEQAKKSIKLANKVVLVEGQIDALACQAAGFHNTVALGGSSLSIYQLYQLKKYTNNFYLLLDNDAAGKKAQEKIISRYSKYVNIKIIILPEEYKDVDQYLHYSNNLNAFDIILGE